MHSHILGIGTANPPIRLTSEQSFYAAGYKKERIRKSFLNSDIQYRHFYFGRIPNLEISDQQNERYLSGTVHTGCRATTNCLNAADDFVKDIDFLTVCLCTGYVCPEVGSRLIAHVSFKRNLQKASIIGLGWAGAVPTLQRAADFVRANPNRKALMLAVEICSACYYVHNTVETVIGNGICADGPLRFCLERIRRGGPPIPMLLTSKPILIPTISPRGEVLQISDYCSNLGGLFFRYYSGCEADEFPRAPHKSSDFVRNPSRQELFAVGLLPHHRKLEQHSTSWRRTTILGG